MDGRGGDTRLEQLDETLAHLERLCGRLEHAERQFKQLTDDCQGVLQGLVTVNRQHATAVAGLNERLGDWCNLESKLLSESARRIEQFERGVSHEWMVLRQLNEEPIADMRDQADTLRRTCLEAAREARLRLEAAEQAYASQAAGLERRMVEWQRRWIDAAAAAPALSASAGAVEPWPLEGVAQLHQELRTAPAPAAEPADGARALVARRVIEAGPPREADGGDETRARPEERGPRASPWWASRAAVVGVVLAVVSLVVSTFALWPRHEPAGTPGPARPATTGNLSTPESATDASRQREERLSEAQRLVERAGSMVEILAAPDLLRYGLSGTGPAASSYAQVLWSRSRGVAVTASRLPPPPAGRSYTLWVISDSQAVAVGVLTPDAAGRASLVVPGPLTLPRLVALRVTLEAAGAKTPAGTACLLGGPTS